MSFFTQTNPTARRIHSQFSHEVTVINFTYDDTAGTNEYADGGWTESTSTAGVTTRLPQSEYDKDAAGSETEHDIMLWINPNDATVTLGEGDEERATEFVDGDSRYKAVSIHDESSLYRVGCREV